MPHNIFISYRRDGGKHLAGRIKDALKTRGFSVFMDIEDLKSGRFNSALFAVIEEATDVIAILTPGCLDWCNNEDDWLRQEIGYAIKCKKNIVPIIARGFQMPSAKTLPPDIAELVEFNGFTPSRELFEASMDKLVSMFLRTPLPRRPSPKAETPLELQNAETRPASQTPKASGPQPPAAVQKSLAVLPFVNMSPDQENEFLCDGITEDMIIALSRVKGLRVPARTSSFVFKNKNEDIRNIGKLLDVETVLEGSVRKSGTKLRITAQLLNVNDGIHIWSQRYDRKMKDVFEIQDDITRSIVRELQVQFGGNSSEQFIRQQTVNISAYEFYLKGRSLWQVRDIELKKAIHYYELALLEDPVYSLAYSGIADTYVLMGLHDFMPSREALAKAKAAAEKALKLDKNSAEAFSAVGITKLFEWDYANATIYLQKSLRINPNNWLARGWLALCLMGAKRDQEAIEQAQIGVQCDPLSVFSNISLGYVYLMSGNCPEALRVLRHAVEFFPDSNMGHWLLGQVLWLMGERGNALTEFQQAVGSLRRPMMLSSLGWALALSGQIDRARQIQRELQEQVSPASTRPLFLAVLHAALNEFDSAFAELEKAFHERELWLPLHRAMTGLMPLHSDRRWEIFSNKVETAKVQNQESQVGRETKAYHIGDKR